MDKKSLQKMIDENGIKYIDFRFTDPLGTWQHFSNHINTFEMDVFEEGIGFDGSSIRCFQSIEASDMILIPDIETAFVDPFFTDPTLVLICDIQDPITGQKYDKDPRYVAKKAEEYVKTSGVGDSIFFGPEASGPKKMLSPTPEVLTYSSAFFATYLGSLSYFCPVIGS